MNRFCLFSSSNSHEAVITRISFFFLRIFLLNSCYSSIGCRAAGLLRILQSSKKADCFPSSLHIRRRRRRTKEERKSEVGWLGLWIINRLVDSFDGISDLWAARSVGYSFPTQCSSPMLLSRSRKLGPFSELCQSSRFHVWLVTLHGLTHSACILESRSKNMP